MRLFVFDYERDANHRRHRIYQPVRGGVLSPKRVLDYVLDRNSQPQSEGVTLIEGDRHALGELLRSYHFDAVLDVTAYDGQDVNDLLDALGSFDAYILISSSAVYPESLPQPFAENAPLGENKFWTWYGTNMIHAEAALLQRVPDAYILRPPYLYGPMNTVYREAFVFDCAWADRTFYIPKDGAMQLQFFHVEDLCQFMDILLAEKPTQHIFNAGNPATVSVKDWVTLCYQTAGKEASFAHVYQDIKQRNYFSFYDYEYALHVRSQCKLMPDTKPLAEGLQESLAWYLRHPDAVNKKPLISFIDQHL